MPLSDISIIHAENLLLDCPVIVEGDHPSVVQEILEDATLLAFDHLLQKSLDSKIDFLLLTGNSFVNSHESLRARIALTEGFELLKDTGIPVFIFPGQEDSLQVWNSFPGLPTNVTILEEDSESPVVVRRNGKTIATISVLNSSILSNDSLQKNSSVDECFYIGLLNDVQKSHPMTLEDLIIPDYFEENNIPDLEKELASSAFDQYDYVAIPGLKNPVTFHLQESLAHCPGTLQPRRPDTEMQNGFALVQMDSDRNVKVQHSKVGPVFWQQEEIEVSNQDSKETFLKKCLDRIRNSESNRNEKIRIVCWSVSGSGSILNWLENSKGCSEFHQKLNKEWDQKSILISPVSITRESGHDESDSESLASRFHEAVQNELVKAPEFIRETIETLKEDHEDSDLLRRLSNEINPEKLIRKSHASGQKWFSE